MIASKVGQRWLGSKIIRWRSYTILYFRVSRFRLYSGNHYYNDYYPEVDLFITIEQALLGIKGSNN